MKKILFGILVFIPGFIFSQSVKPEMKIIPEIGLKFGSQNPIFGLETDLIVGAVFNHTYFVGMGGGYTSNMGLGGATYPIFIDGRIYFSANKLLNHLGFKMNRTLKMQITGQTGISVNSNNPYRTGFSSGLGLGYRLDIFKIKSKSIFPIYAGLNLEYNRTRFFDEYRGYNIIDGHISQLFLLLKIAIDFKTIKL